MVRILIILILSDRTYKALAYLIPSSRAKNISQHYFSSCTTLQHIHVGIQDERFSSDGPEIPLHIEMISRTQEVSFARGGIHHRRSGT